MGINRPTLQFLLHLHKRADLSRLATLGRQSMHVSMKVFRHEIARFGVPAIRGDHFAEPFLKSLGAKEIRTFDVNDYEDATDIVDFCNPLPGPYKGWATTYIDIGSVEHIIDPRQVMLNINHILEPGGTAGILTICNGFPTHGFYQFSPEFFLNVFTEANGFTDCQVYLVDSEGMNWRRAKPVTSLGHRHRLPNLPLYVVCITRKLRDVEKINAMQSFYSGITWASPPSPKRFKNHWRPSIGIRLPGHHRRLYYRDTEPFDPAE